MLFRSDELVSALFIRYRADLLGLLASAPEVENVRQAGLFLRQLCGCIWAHRFIYRDLNDLLTRNRQLETEMKEVLEHKNTAFQVLLNQLCKADFLTMDAGERQLTARHMVLQSTWWLSYAYVLQPRGALEEDNGPVAIADATHALMGLCQPYAAVPARPQFQAAVSALALS